MNSFQLLHNGGIIKLLLSISIAQGVGIVSSLLTKNTREQYQNLVQPSFSPPGWVFGVVWTILFVLMGIAAYRIYSLNFIDPQVKNALLFYAIQLLMNFFWSIIFFRFELRGFALVWLILLWALIVITAVKFYGLDIFAGYLMIPYILWVSFAGVLNYAIWRLNS